MIKFINRLLHFREAKNDRRTDTAVIGFYLLSVYENRCIEESLRAYTKCLEKI